MTRARTFFFAFVAAALFAAPAPADDWENLTGHFLVAKSALHDPNFRETVIYLCRHDPTGAFGLVLNRPIGKVPFSKLAKGFGIDSDDEAEVRIRQGGPVELGLGFIIHSPDYRSEETICGETAFQVTSNLDVVRAIARGEGPKRHLFFFGYSGWGPGQLENEIAQDSWEVIPGDPELIFSEDLGKLWKRALRRRGIDL